MFYFIAGSVDPGFVPSDTDNVIMIAYEVEFLRICLTISENSFLTSNHLPFFSFSARKQKKTSPKKVNH